MRGDESNSHGGEQSTSRPATFAELARRGVRCRNELEAGPRGRQIQVEDPDGNPIELFEPARP